MKVLIVVTVEFSREIDIPDNDRARGAAAIEMKRNINKNILDCSTVNWLYDESEISGTEVWPVEEEHPNNKVGEPLWEES